MTQQPLNFRNKPLVHELKEAEKRRNKQAVRRLLMENLEQQIREYNQQQQQEVDRAMVQV
jgi:hypothetical protein